MELMGAAGIDDYRKSPVRTFTAAFFMNEVRTFEDIFPRSSPAAWWKTGYQRGTNRILT